ncbi:MAG: hypothetical protein LZ174_10310 [Thaumarchaeota archaeon]|nr:hypothetical protein [Candidatus Geocrenenecus arthurdayi]
MGVGKLHDIIVGVSVGLIDLSFSGRPRLRNLARLVMFIAGLVGERIRIPSATSSSLLSSASTLLTISVGEWASAKIDVARFRELAVRSILGR